MEATASRKLNCQICGRAFMPQNGAIGDNVRPSLAEFIKSQRPNWDPQQFICFADLGIFRKDYVKRALEDEIGELTSLDQEVIESLQQHEVLTENIEKQFERKLTFGEHLSDKIAEFGGSWRFIIAFGGVLVVWIIINGVLLATRAFDPYPFILLNLILSCLAALQAPVIMMSQNRAEAHDRPISMIASTPRTIATPAVATGAGIRLVKVAKRTRMEARGTPASPLDVIMKATIMESCCAKPKCCPTLGPADCTIKTEVTARKIIDPSRLKA